MNIKRTMLIVIGLIFSAALFSASVSANIRSGNMYYGQYSRNQDDKELFKRAVECYTDALEKEPDLPEVLIRLAELKTKKLRFDYPSKDEMSADFYNRLLEIRPMHKKALDMLNALPEDEKERKKALKAMRLKEKKVQDIQAEKGVTRKVSIIENYKFSSQSFINYCDGTLLKISRSLSKDGKTDEANTVLNKLLEVNPEYAPAVLYSAFMKADAGDNAGAIEIYNRYLTLKPDDVSAIVYLAQAYTNLLEEDPAEKEGYVKFNGKYIKKENLEKAIETYKKVLTFGNDAGVEYEIGRFYLALDDADNAIKYYKTSIETDPVKGFDQTCFTLSYIYQVKKNDTENSIQYLKKGVDFQIENDGKDKVKIQIGRVKTLASNLFKAEKYAEAESYADILFSKAVDTPSKNLAKTIGNQAASKLKDSALAKKWSSR